MVEVERAGARVIALATFGALLVGLTLGLLGAGGSIVTVPVLVYVVGESPKLAITESLIIVAIIACAAAIRYHREKLIDWRNAVLLGVPGMLGAFQGAALSSALSGRAQMVVFASVAGAAAVRLLTLRESPAPPANTHRPAWQPILTGIGVGILTGLVGVGGGFLLIPALVLLLGVPMRRAVGTSLVVIVANSLIGFAKHWSALTPDVLPFPWTLVTIFAFVGIVGAALGTRLSPRLPQRALRIGFAWILVAVAVGTLAAQFFTVAKLAT